MVRHKLLAPLAWGWMPFCSLTLVISMMGHCHGQVTLEKAPADKAKAAVSVESKGVAVGKAFPDFELKDQDGSSFSLSKALKQGPVVLVVYRSADW